MTPVAGKLHLAVVYMADGGGNAAGRHLHHRLQPDVDAGQSRRLTRRTKARSRYGRESGAAPTTGTPVVTTNLGGGMSFFRSHFVDISNASGIGNMFADVIAAGQGVSSKTFSHDVPAAHQRSVHGGSGRAEHLSRYEPDWHDGHPRYGRSAGSHGRALAVRGLAYDVRRCATDEPSDTHGRSRTTSTRGCSLRFLPLALPLAEGIDVTRTLPAPIGVETAHSVGAFQTNIGSRGRRRPWAVSWRWRSRLGRRAAGERLGATSNYISTFETMLGRTVDSQRVSVADTAALVTWGTGGWATAATANTAGRAVFVSCFLGANTWAQVAAGNVNAFLDSPRTRTSRRSRQPGVFCLLPGAGG